MLDQELISGIAAIIISLLLSYFPKLDVWYAAQPAAKKALLAGGATVLAVGGIVGAGCLGLWGSCVTDWREIVRTLFVAIFANQSTYLLSPQTKRAKNADDEAWIARAGYVENDDDYRDDPA